MSGDKRDERLSREAAHAYWTAPNDGSNAPQRYIDLDNAPRLTERSRALLEVFERHAVPRDARVLEIGCNAGRNLKFLLDAGYRDLTAIEISQAAVDAMAQALPDVHAAARIHVGSVEDILPSFPPDAFDVIFTMAVLIHIPVESEWLFEAMAERARRLVVFEHETPHPHPRLFPRAYRPIFEGLGLRQVEEIHPVPGMIRAYCGRVFTRRSSGADGSA